MAGRHVIGADLRRPVEQHAELDPAVAGHAGIRRAPLHVLGNEVGNDALLELLAEIHHVVGDAEPAGHNPRVVPVIDRAAAVFELRVAAHAFVVPQVHRDADDLAARFLEHRGRHRAVHAAAHGHHDRRPLRRQPVDGRVESGCHVESAANGRMGFSRLHAGLSGLRRGGTGNPRSPSARRPRPWRSSAFWSAAGRPGPPRWYGFLWFRPLRPSCRSPIR